MRPVTLGSPIPGREKQWLLDAMREIERASLQDVAAIADNYDLGTFTVTRSIDPGTATLTDLINVFCTFLYDMQKRGTDRDLG